MRLTVTLAVLVVLSLTVYAAQPRLAAAPPPAGASQDQQQTELLDEELGEKLQAALEAAVASPATNWPGAVLHVRARASALGAARPAWARWSLPRPCGRSTGSGGAA